MFSAPGNNSLALAAPRPGMDLANVQQHPNQALGPGGKQRTSSLEAPIMLLIGTQIISASPDKTVRVWDVETGKQVKRGCKKVAHSHVSETKEQKGEASSVMHTYKHHCDKGLDIHEIFVKKSRTRVLLSYVGVVFLLANVCQSLLAKESLCLGSLWSITFGIIVAKCLQYKPVKKESVVIMPAFGVQLEIHFWSGRVHRRFVPISKILKPLLNECVTPVTCYWSLALLLRDEEELMLVFQKCRPPVKMLVPIWKALCSFTSSERRSPSAVSQNRTVRKHDSFGAIV